MEKQQKIQQLLNRLDELEGKDPARAIERLLTEEEAVSRETLRESKTGNALNILAKALQKVQDDKRPQELLDKLTEANTANEERFKGMDQSFSDKTESLLKEIKDSESRGTELTKKEVESIVSRFMEAQDTYEADKSDFSNRSSLLGAEVSRIGQELPKIYGELRNLPNLSPSIEESSALARTAQKTADEISSALKDLETKLSNRINNIQHGSGNANRNIAINGNSSTLSKYTDINFIQGSNLSIVYANNNTTKQTDITISATGGSSSVSGVPGGSNTQIQFNDNGVFGGASVFTWNKSSSVVALNGSLGVGTATPTAPLDIEYTQPTISAPGLRIHNNDMAYGSLSLFGYPGYGGALVFGERTGADVVDYAVFGNSSGLQFAESGVATPRVFIQKTTGYVGVQTNSPTAELDVAGRSKAQTIEGQQVVATNYFDLSVAGANQVFITNSGGVNGAGGVLLGVGHMLQFADADAAGGTYYSAFARDSRNNVSLRGGDTVNNSDPQTFRVYNKYDAALTNYERGVLDWGTTSSVFTMGTENAGTGVSLPIAIKTGSVERVRIDTAGNVGIGTSTPGARLQVGLQGSVAGTVRVAGSTAGYVQIQPASVAGDWTFTIPANDGNAGQYLLTDGNGITQWASVVATGGSGITRSVNNIAASTSIASSANTDYVYFAAGNIAVNLPTPIGNTNLYTVKNVGSGTITIDTIPAHTIDGSSTAILPVQYTSLDIISNGADWLIT